MSIEEWWGRAFERRGSMMTVIRQEVRQDGTTSASSHPTFKALHGGSRDIVCMFLVLVHDPVLHH